MEKDLKNSSYCETQGNGDNKVSNRGDLNNNEAINSFIIVDNSKSTTNYTYTATNNVVTNNGIIKNLNITDNFNNGDNIVSTSIVNVGLDCYADSHMDRRGNNMDINLAGVAVNRVRLPGQL